MKILNSGLKIFFWIILIISFDTKSDISVKELDLKEVFKSGRGLMSLGLGDVYKRQEIINMIQKNIFKPEFNIFIFTVSLKAVVLLLQGEWIDLLYYFFHLKVFQFH